MLATSTDAAVTGRTRDLLRLAWPLMFSNLAYTAVGFTDMLVVGRLGVVEVGAVGLASLGVLTLLLLFRGSLNTAATFVARALGGNDHTGVLRWSNVFLALSLIGLPVMLLGPLLVDGLFTLLRPDPAITEVAREYARVRMYEAPMLLLGTACLAIMVGLGNTRTPMMLAWTLMLVNAAFAVLFVFGFGWGVAGAAWASVIAASVQGALAFVLLRALHGRTCGSFRFVRPHRHELASVGRVSVPAGLTELGEVSAFMALMGVISRLGPTELAASQIANQLASLGFLPAFALAAATGSLLSRALGAGRPDVAASIGWRGAGVAAALMGLLGVAFLLIPGPLIRLFNNDPAVLAMGTLVLAMLAVFQLLDGLAIVLGGALGGAGDTRFRLIVTLAGSWLVMVVGAHLLAPRFGVIGAWGAALAYISLIAVVYAVRFRSGRWKRLTL